MKSVLIVAPDDDRTTLLLVIIVQFEPWSKQHFSVFYTRNFQIVDCFVFNLISD